MVRREWGEVVVDRVVSFYLAECPAQVRVAGVGSYVGELLGEMFGYCGVIGACGGVAITCGEGDGLVGRNSGPLTGEIPDSAPESLYVCSV